MNVIVFGCPAGFCQVLRMQHGKPDPECPLCGGSGEVVKKNEQAAPAAPESTYLPQHESEK